MIANILTCFNMEGCRNYGQGRVVVSICDKLKNIAVFRIKITQNDT